MPDKKIILNEPLKKTTEKPVDKDLIQIARSSHEGDKWLIVTITEQGADYKYKNISMVDLWDILKNIMMEAVGSLAVIKAEQTVDRKDKKMFETMKIADAYRKTTQPKRRH